MILTHWLKRPDGSARAPTTTTPRLHLEALEDRAVPAAIDFNPATGVLTLNGTTGVDSIRLLKSGADTQVGVNTEWANFAPGQVKRVDVFAGNGDDQILVAAADFPVNVQAQGGDDRIAVHMGQLNGALNVSGGEANGSNFLRVMDLENQANTTYSLSAGLLARQINGAQAVSSFEYSGVGTLYLEGGSGDNDYKLEGAAAPRVFIEGGTGDDAFVLAPSARNLDALAGISEISFLGGGGIDRLVAEDLLNNKSATYNLRGVDGPDNTFHRTGTPTIRYTDFDILIARGGSGGTGGNTWNINSQRVETYLGGGAGADRFVIDDGSEHLSSAFLGLVGNGGHDTASLNDSAQTSAKTYELISSTLRHRLSNSTTESQIVLSDIDSTTLYGGSGANTYNLQDVAANTQFALFAGAGSDTIRVGGGPSGLHTVAGGVTVFAGGGFDSMDVVDSTNGYTGTTYTVNGSLMTRKINGVTNVNMNFAGVDDLDLFGGSASNIYEVKSVVATTDLDIQAGNGNDEFRFGVSNSMNGIAGTVSVSGNGGVDYLDVRDTINTAPTTYSLSASVLTRQINGQQNQAQVSYNGFESVQIFGGTASNTYHVYSTTVGVNSSIHAGTGNDTFRVTPHGSNLNAIGGQVTVLGYGGTDTILIDDSLNAVHATYNLSPATLSRVIGSSAARINVQDLEGMTVLGGSGNNTYNALNTDPDMPVEFRAGNGVDTLHVSPVSQTLRTTPGGVSFVGDWVDTIVIHDELNPHPATYVLSANELVRKVAGQDDTTIRFSGDEKLIINAGTGNDILTVASAALAIPVTFNGGAGNDALKGALGAENTFELTGPNAGKLTIAGGAGALQFSNTENLGGGDRGDRFRFMSAGELSGAIDAGFGSDTLDYSALTTGVAVDLSAGLAPRTGSIGSIENVFGGSGDDNLRGNDLDNVLLGNGGNDVLVGGAGNDILVGGDGSDTINGGAGRNVLIGGKGGDVITGGSDEDLLIAGFTAFDNNVPALRSIMAEWASSAPIETRVGHLLGTIPGGLNSVFLIAGPDPQVPPGGINPDPRSVFDDGVRDVLTGAAGVDWFFFSPNDVTDIVAGEFGTDTGDGTI